MIKQHIKTGLAVIVLHVPVLAVAAEYSIQPEVSMTADHDDNIRLARSGEDAVAGVKANPGVEFAYKTETLEATVDLGLEFSRFNDSDYDSDDQDIEFGLSKEGERLTWGVTADVVRDSTRTSEFEDSGRVTNIERREQYSIAPYGQYWLGENLRVDGSLSYVDVDYANDLNYTSYKYVQASTGLIFLFSETAYVGLNLGASDYEGDPRVVGVLEAYSESDALDYYLSGNYEFTEKWSLNGRLGYSDRDNVYVQCVLGTCASLDTSSSSETVDLGLLFKSEGHRFESGVSISDSPSSDGVVVQSSELTLEWSWQVSERGSLESRLLYGEKESSDDNSTVPASSNVERDYRSASMRYRYRLSEEWFSHVEYRYRYNDRSTATGTAESNVIAVGLTYRPAKTSWSR